MVAKINNQASELNTLLSNDSKAVASLLTEYGERMYFPKKGVIQQTVEGRVAEINATIGIAREEDGSLMVLDAFAQQFSKLSSEKAFGYAPTGGFQELRELWRKEILRKNPSLQMKAAPAAITTPVIVSGLTDGLKLIGELFLGYGEQLILPNPNWENYGFTYFHGALDEFPLFVRGKLNLDGLEEKLSGENGRKKLLLNFPHNPSGYTPSQKEAGYLTDTIHDCAKRNNAVLVVCDDAYFGLSYDAYQESLFSKFADLDERVLAVKIDGVSKEYYAWGLRVAFVTYGFKGMSKDGASALESKTIAAMRGSKSCAASPSQEVALHALRHPEVEKQRLDKFAILKARHDLVQETLAQNSSYQEFFDAEPFNSGYFMCVKLKKHDAYDIRLRLLEQFNTAVIAINDSTLRIAYSSVQKTQIPRLFKNLYDACRFADDYSGG